MKKFFAPQVLKSGAVILTALFFVTGGSYSAWTSQVKLSGNTFETGTVDISVEPATAIFNLNHMAPGIWSESEILVKNNGSLDYQYSIGAEISEEYADDENALALFGALWVEIYDESDELVDEDTLADLNMPLRYLEGDDSETLTIKIKLDDDADDTYQDLATSFDLIFDATQYLGDDTDNFDDSMVINEIAWMGTKASGTDEWIELYNATDSEIDLTSWKIEDGTGEFSLSGVIPSGGYYLIEDNEDATDVAGDLIISSLGLTNSGEQLTLKNGGGDIVDTANGTEGWFAGSNDDNKPTMERINVLVSGTDEDNWADNDGVTKNGLDRASNEIYGTPKAENSAGE